MKLTMNLVIYIGVVALMSCGDCEDKTLDVSSELNAFVSYEQETKITMVNGDNETIVFTVIPDVDISNDKDGDCIKTSIKPFFTLNTDTQDDFMRIWVSLNEDFLLGDHEQLWFIADNTDGSIFDSGMIRDPLLTLRNINLNGATFNDVISLVKTSQQNTQTAIYLQRGVGIIGFELMNETWVIQ